LIRDQVYLKTNKSIHGVQEDYVAKNKAPWCCIML